MALNDVKGQELIINELRKSILISLEGMKYVDAVYLLKDITEQLETLAVIASRSALEKIQMSMET
jgi:hypothetical protein